MLLSYRDPDFWKTFHERHWRPRVPVVLRQPFREFPFSESSVLRAMNAVEDGLRESDRRIRYIVSVGAQDKAPRRRLRELVRHKSASMEQLEENCTQVYKKQSFGLMLHELQSLDPDIWSGITSFIQDAHQCIEFPVARAFLDLFIGNYASSFLGLHKDTQEIFAFVLREEKTMLAWPFEYFLPKVKGLTPATKYFSKRLPVDYRKYRKDALVLNAKPGDVIYWPASYWHIAEAKPGCFSAMISLGIFRQDSLLAGLGAKRPEPTALRSREMPGVKPASDAARQLRWMTSFGFELGGPISPTANSGAVTVKKKPASLILWKVDAARDRLLVSTNGHSATFPKAVRLVPLLESIVAGETVSVDKLEKHRTSETNWNKDAILATRPRSGSLVDWLLRVHAVERRG